MNRRSWLKVAAGGLAAIAAWRPWRWAPPDVWVRKFHVAEGLDPPSTWDMLGRRHPLHTDMICRSVDGLAMFEGGRLFSEMTVHYGRLDGPFAVAKGLALQLYPVGPDAPAHWVEVA